MTITDAPPAAPGPPPPSQRNVAGAVIVAIVVVFVAVAILLTIIGVNARSDASRDDDRTATLTAARAASAKRQHAVDRQRIEIRKLANAVAARWSALGAALNDMIVAQNHFIDVVNHASDQYNGGDHSAAAATFRTDGAPALAAMVDKNAAVQKAYAAAQTALQRLKEAS